MVLQRFGVTIDGSVPTCGPPSAPTGLAAVAGDAEVSLSWTAPSFDGGTAITRYHVALPELDRAHAVAASQTHFRLRDLPPGRHLVKVRAINVIGGSTARSFYVSR